MERVQCRQPRMESKRLDGKMERRERRGGDDVPAEYKQGFSI